MDEILRISPLPRIRPRRIPVGVLTDSGEYSGETRPQIVYCNSAAPALRLAREKGGTALVVKTAGGSRWVKFTIAGTDYYPGATVPDAGQIIAFRDFCFSHGISARSIQAMSFYLARESLAGYFDVSRGVDIPFSLFPPGPRMHAVPGIFRNVIQSDISSAYLWGIGYFTPASSYRSEKRVSLEDSTAENSWSLVRFRHSRSFHWGIIPDMSSGGSTVFPTVTKEWSKPLLLSGSDILAGILCGVQFQFIRSWIPTARITEPFRAFMHDIWNLRRESAFPSVAKQAGNTLWGNFVAGGNMKLATFNARTGKHSVRRLPPREKLCQPIGYGVLGKLRSRLIVEGVGNATIHAHTDGVISPYPVNSDWEGPGSWRVSEKFREVEIIGPSWYKTVDHSGVVNYKIAGRIDGGIRAAQIFGHKRRELLASLSPQSRESRPAWAVLGE